MAIASAIPMALWASLKIAGALHNGWRIHIVVAGISWLAFGAGLLALYVLHVIGDDWWLSSLVARSDLLKLLVLSIVTFTVASLLLQKAALRPKAALSFAIIMALLLVGLHTADRTLGSNKRLGRVHHNDDGTISIHMEDGSRLRIVGIHEDGQFIFEEE